MKRPPVMITKWTKEMHAKAAAEGKSLISIAVCGFHAKQSSFEVHRVATPEMVALLDKTLRELTRLINEERKNQAKAVQP